MDLAIYLRPTPCLDADHPRVAAFARETTRTCRTRPDQAVALFREIRDRIRYDPYHIDLSDAAMRASAVLARGTGFCISKAVLLAAAARALGIPSRLGFGDVKNHLATERLQRVLDTDVLAWHGWTELFLHDRWVKATPAFNATLCERFNVAPLTFDGHTDAMFQQFDRAGKRYMEYVRDRGTYADLPLDELRTEFRQHYAVLLAPR